MGTDQDFLTNYAFMLAPIATWTLSQWAIFPWLFVIPAELLALVVDAFIYLLPKAGNVELPGPPKESRPPLEYSPDVAYIAFNRLVMLPFVALLNMKVIFASSAVVWDFADATVWNTVLAFVISFSMSDFVYYVGHRVVHRYKFLYTFIHKHHHGEPLPRRGWADTCNAHPTDFFYTGVSTSPMSTLWLLPAGSVHVGTIAAMMYTNMFVGAFGHCRLDFNLGFFNTRFHAGHHALSNCNFAQNVEIWDRIFGTFRHLPMRKDREAKKVK